MIVQVYAVMLLIPKLRDVMSALWVFGSFDK